MDEYTIYCTPEQTKKASLLNAPIKKEYAVLPYWLIPPTAEQMIGWLESHLIEIQIQFFGNGWEFNLFAIESDGEQLLKRTEGHYNSRKEATLAAIDSAIDYLLNKLESKYVNKNS